MTSKCILGFDIGGANTKAALVTFNGSDLTKTYSCIDYFPFWEKTLNDIPDMLLRISNQILSQSNFKIEDIDIIAIAITAELSDAFETKREGIFQILDALKKVFGEEKLRFISTENKFLRFKEALSNWEAICAANWVSTALYLGHFVEQGILIDAGSTTIDIIPIFNSIPITKGKDDISRIFHHELIYTGGLRATIPSIIHKIPIDGKIVRISFEKFALISDVHRILGNISEKEYINDTADNRSTSLDHCYARLSRMLCTDLEHITTKKLDKIANFIYDKQLDIIKREIELFFSGLIRRKPEFTKSPFFILTGLSADFLVKIPLVKLGFNNINYYEDITHLPDNISSSALAVAGAFYFQRK